MQNEALTRELNELQERFNKEIENVKNKYEIKQLNRWYKCDKRNFIMFVISKDERRCGEYYNGYGFYNNTWFVTDKDTRHLDDCELMTPEEVQEALTKEAVKKYDGQKVKCLGSHNDIGNIDFSKHSKYDCKAVIFSDKCLWIGKSDCNGNIRVCVFDNGQWAEIVKEKTLDDLAMEFKTYKHMRNSAQAFSDFLTKNKQEVINILNNL